MNKPVRILVADDHELFRRGLVEILQEEDGFHLVGEAENGSQVIDLAIRSRPDVILMDVHMPGMDGIEAVRRLKDIPGTRILMLTISERDEHLIESLSAGAAGYLLKNTRPEALIAAIRQIVAGHAALSPEVTPSIIQAAVHAKSREPGVHLSKRELEVLELLAQGATSADVARDLVISENTVKTYIHRILKKLDAANRAEAVARAAAFGLLKSEWKRD